jgi:hypothetical protein
MRASLIGEGKCTCGHSVYDHKEEGEFVTGCTKCKCIEFDEDTRGD